MSRPQISMQQLPPLSLPLGYFRTAPLFGIASGLALCAAGTAAWSSRWTPATLATTHLLVLCCMMMIMFGALVQIMPVLSSTTIPGAERLSGWIRSLLGIGGVTLAVALQFEIGALFIVAGLALAAAFGMYLVPLCACLLRRIGGGDSMFAVRLAVFCLLTTIGLGLTLAAGHVAPESFPGFRAWTDVHVGFGLCGWITILVMAVSFQVIPMFHVAPDYPRVVRKPLPILLVTGLVLQVPWLIATSCGAYAIITLVILARRKRRSPDVTVRFWQMAMLALLGCVACWSLAPTAEFVLGVLFVVGFALTVMIGMLYKIVPFLVFTHLQRACLGKPTRIVELPSMQKILDVDRGRWQLTVHAVAVLATTAAVLQPAAGMVAGLALIANFAWLLRSITVAQSCYERIRDDWARRDAVAPPDDPQVLSSHLHQLPPDRSPLPTPS